MSTSNLTLLELNRFIKQTIEQKFDHPIWVVAEINNINLHRSGHCYIELVQKSIQSDSIVAQSKAVIWSSIYPQISMHFHNVTNTELRKGMSVLLKVSVDFHELYGFSLNIRDIDPNYTLGDLERRKKEIIDKLRTEGVIDMNKELEIPPVIQKIAIISSNSTAGYGDFISQLNNNKYKYKFDTELFEANMQGTNTEISIINALDNIHSSETNFDVAIIVRGGGSKSDLNYFDNYNIAYHITQFHIPVLTGIGHERDDCITDIVACKKLKTPTAVANFIIENNLSFENNIDRLNENIIKEAKDYIHTNNLYIANLCIELSQTKDIITSQKEYLNNLYYKIKNSSKSISFFGERQLDIYKEKLSLLFKRSINEKQSEITHKQNFTKKVFSHSLSKHNNILLSLEKHIDLVSPEKILKRGYSITKLNGKHINSNTKLKQGDTIQTCFADKIIESKISKL